MKGKTSELCDCVITYACFPPEHKLTRSEENKSVVLYKTGNFSPHPQIKSPRDLQRRLLDLLLASRAKATFFLPNKEPQ